MLELLFGFAIAGALQGQATTLWGGMHVEMNVTDMGAHLEFDCAHGTIDEPLRVDAKGAFTAQGTFTPERGGPTREGDDSRTVKASYTGTIDKDSMRLTIVIGAGDQRDEQHYVLVRNQHGRVMKCR